MTNNILTLAPSELDYLPDKCPRCFYLAKVKKITVKSFPPPVFSNFDVVQQNYFKNLKYFIVDCLRYEKHYSHFNLNDVLNLIKIIKPKKTLLTNLNNEMDYAKLKKKLPYNLMPAYDGLTLFI